MSQAVGVELRNPPIVGLLREVLLVTQRASDHILEYRGWLDPWDGDVFVHELIEVLTRHRFSPPEA